MTDERLKLLYKKAIFNEQFTTSDLKNIGFSADELTKLISDGILNRVKKGVYELTEDALFMEGVRVAGEGNFLTARVFFKRCYKKNPLDVSVCQQMIRVKLRCHEHVGYDKYIDNMYLGASNPNEIADANLFLYMLNHLEKLSDENVEKAKKITLDDVILKVGYEKYGMDVYTQNSLRQSIMKQVFKTYFKNYDNIIETIGIYSMKDVAIHQVVKSLTTKAVNRLNYQIALIKNEDFEKLFTFLKDAEEKRGLPTQEARLLQLVSAILEMKRTGEVPKCLPCHGERVHELIATGNYAEALRKYNESLQMRDINVDETPLRLMLNKVCERIYGINHKASMQSYFDKLIDKINTTGDMVLLTDVSLNEMAVLKCLVDSNESLSCFEFEDIKKQHLVIKKCESMTDFDAVSLIEEANNEFLNGNYDRAIEIYKKGMWAEPYNADIYAGLARGYEVLGQKGLALDYYIVAKTVKFKKTGFTDYIVDINRLKDEVIFGMNDDSQSRYRVYVKSLMDTSDSQ